MTEGAAGLPIKPYRPRCNFGTGHLWVMEPMKGHDEAPWQCATCGVVSSDHPLPEATHHFQSPTERNTNA